jgi:hypothetical protein
MLLVFNKNSLYMMHKIRFHLLALLVAVSSATESFADKICLKSTVSRGAVVHQKKKITSGRCPKGYLELINTATLTGASGSNGSDGADGAIRVFGDGSNGALTISSSAAMDNVLGQYTDVTINSGVTLTVPFGTTIRCTGTFTNNGTIVVTPRESGAAMGDGGSNKFLVRFAPAEPGFTDSPPGMPDYGTGAVFGGYLGLGATVASQKNLPRSTYLSSSAGTVGLNGVGGGAGGVLRILCKTAINNQTGATIRATGGDGQIACAGGGGGGYVLLASAGAVNNLGSVDVRGGFGAASSTVCAAGGGGGGGIIHFLAPVVLSNGTNLYTAGSGGDSTVAGSVSSTYRSGGGGGGGSGGNGGTGGSVSADDSSTAGQSGSVGQFFSASMDPTSVLF